MQAANQACMPPRQGKQSSSVKSRVNSSSFFLKVPPQKVWGDTALYAEAASKFINEVIYESFK